jgi:hypothetical protein
VGFLLPSWFLSCPYASRGLTNHPRIYITVQPITWKAAGSFFLSPLPIPHVHAALRGIVAGGCLFQSISLAAFDACGPATECHPTSNQTVVQCRSQPDSLSRAFSRSPLLDDASIARGRSRGRTQRRREQLAPANEDFVVGRQAARHSTLFLSSISLLT